MSSKQAQKEDVKQQKLKQEDMDDDEEMEHEDKKPRHKDHHALKKKKGRKGNDDEDMHHADTNQQDADMVSEDDIDDDEEDDDEYDDEIESQGSFIAPDEEVEEELEEERARKMEEEREKKKKKKRKRQQPKKLDEEDLDLIQDNTGIQVPRRRLKKVVDQENETREEQKMVKKEEEFSDEEEKIDTKQKRPQITAKIYRDPQQRFQQRSEQQEYDSEKMQIASSIFQDPVDIRQQIKATQKRQTGVDQMKKEPLESMFDGDEIDDQLATQQDKQIAEKDIPERLQLKIGERFQPSSDEVSEEAEWIFERLQQDAKRDMLHNSEAIKRKIVEVINLFRTTHLDIPMIIKYRRYIYAKELDEQDVQNIFNLDQEFGQFKMQKMQILQFLKKIIAFNPDAKVYEEELFYAKTQHDLNGFSALVSFLKNYYHEELSTLPDEQKRKIPARQDKVQVARKQKLDDFVRKCMLRPELFTENLQHNKLIHKPPEPQDMLPFHLTQKYLNEQNSEEMKVLSGACDFAATELASQPYIRQLCKQHFYEFGSITTTPTDKGMKDLDVFHPSYRVKRITDEPIMNLHPRYRNDRQNQEIDDDLFLDIVQNERLNLVNVTIQLDKKNIDKLYEKIEPFYLPSEESPQWDIMRKEVLRRLVDKCLVPEIVKEVKTELFEVSENYVIRKCQEKYKELLLTGPFDCQEGAQKQDQGRSQSKSKSKYDEEIIKDRPRYNVMGVILQQLDNSNSVVTVAVVDKYGELVAHKDLMHLMPPRKMPQMRQGGTDEDEQRHKKLQLSIQEEMKEHEKDKDKIKDLIAKHQVDLIVVGANKLEARRIKETLKDIADNMKNFGGNGDSDDEKDARRSKKRGDYPEESRKEAFVIWGSLEVPKLFASSHQSEKLLKNCNLLVKQAVSLARFEQDPMCEMLNLWSPIPSENSALSLGLHSLQKLVNQSKLADSLEDINVYCMNEVGIDLNTLIDHDHMHNQLQFISGLGPRKAKRLIQKLKQLGRKVFARSEFLSNIIIGKNVFISAIAFLKIKVPPEELEKNQGLDLLDQTRIHLESYTMAIKVACDVISQNIEQLTDYQKYNAVKEVIQNPMKLRTLDLKQYEEELKVAGQANMTSILDLIIEELQHPFKDPREYRTPNKLQISNKDLFYFLIDESERSFKAGIIVTATIVKVDKTVLCKLDNGLDAIIHKEEICNNNERLEDVLQSGQVINGRIDKISDNDEKRFSVTLKCKRADLERHDKFIDKSKINYPEEDLVNLNIKIESREKAQGRYQSRRINHPKFKNISSGKALEELQAKDIGEFVFRPSSKGPDNITLTWKFYHNNIVHIDIQESEKPTGASIGNKLHISDEVFDNLQEIMERYIIPCNRALREVINHAKFLSCSNEEELAVALRQEKQDDQQRIPYRFCVLDKFPQHVVLGYIAKGDKIEKEYIKIKPRGYYFHDRYHNPFQHLINWFKENFRQKEYLKLKHRTDKRPPELKQQDQQRKSVEPQKREPAMDWEPAQPTNRQGGNSVHSMHEDRYGETPMVKSEYNNPGRSTTSEIGGVSRYGGASTGAQFSEYNQSNQMQMSENAQRPKGPCFNCQQEGHMSRDCPTKRVSSYGRGGGGRPDRNENRWDDNREQNKESEQPQWGNDNAASKSPAAQWGDAPMKTESKSPTKYRQEEQNQPGYEGGWGEQPVSGGWGQKTPSRNEPVSSGATWGDQQANDNWGGAANDDDNGRRDSPARSQRSFDDNRGGRGRGRGGRGRGSGAPGGGNSRECFKCHQEGHMARECPNASSDDRGRGRGGGGGSRECFKCHQEGHMARECPNQQESSEGRGRGRGRGRGDNQGGGGRPCYKCGQEGHFARECPSQSEGQGERPYKRQRRDEQGGSYRRNNDDNNNEGGNAGGWDNANEQNNQAWGSSGGWNSNSQQNEQKDEQPWGGGSSNNQGKKDNEGGGWNDNANSGSGW